MPGQKRPHLDEEGVAAAIAKVEEQLDQLRRHQAEAAATTEPANAAAPPAASTPQQTPAAATPAQPTQQSTPLQSTAAFSTPASAGNGRPQPFQARDYRTSIRRPREDTRGRLYYVYICKVHRRIYCQTCGEYVSADEWRDQN